MYGIAKYFSTEARETAVKQQYLGTIRRNRNGWCPLGVMIRFDFGKQSSAPLPEDVADILTCDSDDYRVTVQEASRFIHDWDHGNLDIREALL